jgi:DNA-3-methyladenine glycosylase II
VIAPLDAIGFPRRIASLARADADLARVVSEYGVPPFWARPAGFATLVLLVLEQQVSLESGRATFDRLTAATGGTPERILAAADGELRRAGLSRQKERYVRELAASVTSGRLDIDGLAVRSDEEARSALLAQIGIGPWTADCYLLAALRRPDVWPVGDRALQVAVAEVKRLPAVPGAVELLDLGERWRPWRSVAARLLWHGYLSRRGRTELDPVG